MASAPVQDRSGAHPRDRLAEWLRFRGRELRIRHDAALRVQLGELTQLALESPPARPAVGDCSACDVRRISGGWSRR